MNLPAKITTELASLEPIKQEIKRIEMETMKVKELTKYLKDQDAKSPTESNVAHTPGPWICLSKGITEHFGNTGEDFSIQYSDGQLRSHIAEISFMGLCEEHGETQANARLIAAAPEMLEALKECLEDLESVCLGEGCSESPCMIQARLIIARATGKGKA